MLTYNFILILVLVLCVLLVLIILAQNPKGGGLSSSIGGGDGGQMFGVQQTNKFLVNTTWVLATAIGLIILFSSFLIDTPNEEGIDLPQLETIEKEIEPEPEAPIQE